MKVKKLFCQNITVNNTCNSSKIIIEAVNYALTKFISYVDFITLIVAVLFNISIVCS